MMSNSTPASKNWMLNSFRKWHSWGGLFLSVFILIVAVTGILLNHKDLIFKKGEKGEQVSGSLRSTTDISTVPISFSGALELARSHYGDVPLEKIELKDEYGKLMYKIARGEGDEIRIDATTGQMTSKYGMSLAAGEKGMLNWAKIVDDLHTGKIFGTVGKLTVDATSGVIILLTLSGIYLWGAPILRKRQNARNRKAAAVDISDNARRTKAELVPDRTLVVAVSSDESTTDLRKQRTKEILEAARRKRDLEPQLK